jgi:GR25 family glycosyltransferase involved in LPS biosynthesis
MKKIENYYASFVNLDHRGDRLQHMFEQLNRIGLNATRTRGMKPEEYKGDFSKVATMFKRTQGAVGCHFSQVQVMKDALARDKHAFVMEDDLVFCEDFAARWDYIQDWMDTNSWDVVWLGASFHVNPPYWHNKGGSNDRRNDASANLGYDAKLTDDPRIVRTYGAFATFAYLVNKNSIQKIMDLFDEHLHKSIGIDWLFILLQPQLNCFSFVPGCVKQMDSQSDIGDGITRWSGFLQLNGTKENSAYVYQERMEDFNPLTFNWNEVAR